MEARGPILNRIVAAVWLIFAAGLPATAQDAPASAGAGQEAGALDALYESLKTAEAAEAKRIEREIWREWSRSGSPAFDLLLERGRKAMEQGDPQAAIEHLTALIDHAPGFAEGWNARATAYFQAGLHGPSVADIRQVLALNPRHFGAMAGFGMILEEAGQTEQARAVYQAALAIHPHLEGVKEALERLEKAETGQDL